MKIHHLRNATFVIESGEKYILIDPMLGDKGTLPPFARFKHPSKKNRWYPCPTTRSQLKQEIENMGLLSKVSIPNDGDILTFEFT